MTRLLILSMLFLALAACNPPRMADYSNMMALPERLPNAGTSLGDVEAWLNANGYAPGARVLQSEAELRRRPGDPLVYSLEVERMWWMSAHRTTRDLCVTLRTVYYRVDDRGALMQAIQTLRSDC